MTHIQEEAFANYEATHAGHVTPGGKARAEWAYRFVMDNFVRHLPLRGHHLLEIGVGTGEVLEVFRKLGYVCVGTDLDPRNCSTESRVFRHNVFEKPIKSHQFDVIVMMGLIEHIRKDDLLPSLRNVRKMLAPGGVLFITTQNMDSPLGDHFRYLDITHELGFTRESLNQVGRLAGFQPDVYLGVYPPEPVRGIRGLIAASVKKLWRQLYTIHVRVCGGAMADTWWQGDTLVGVWRV